VFAVGESYLVYANDYDRATNEYGTSICTRTSPLANAEEDVKVLGSGKEPRGAKMISFSRAKHNKSLDASGVNLDAVRKTRMLD
jgi:hypothetical protein